MAVRIDIQRKWSKQHHVLDQLYDRFKVGDEIKGAVSQFIPEWGEWNTVYAAWKVFVAAEILLNVGNRRNPAYGVMKTLEEAHESLKAEQLASVGQKRPQKPAEESILRHVAGSDAQDSPFDVLRPLRKDESAALVESARQYLGRKELKASKLKELRDGGINVPDSAIPLSRDERLEHILLVVPYVDSILSADTKYEQLAVKYRELETRFGEMKRSYDGLKRWRDQKMAEAVEGVTLTTALDRKIDDVVGRASAKTNGHAESGTPNGRAEYPAGSEGAGSGAPAGEGEPEVDSSQARSPQPRDETKTATR